MQVPTAQGGYGAGEQPSGPMKLAPEDMQSVSKSAAVLGSTAYFSNGQNVYSYTVPENEWTKLPQCKYEYFAMAIVNDALTTIGGCYRQRVATTALLSICGGSWEEVLPRMPTERMKPATANSPAHLVVAGGQGRLSYIVNEPFIETVEVLNTKTLQWSTASSLPEAVSFPQMRTCGGCLYLASGSNNVLSCSVEDLLNSSDDDSVWTRLASIPTPQWSSLATLQGRVLAIGGEDGDDNPTGAIHCYDVATNSWSVIGEIPTPRYSVLAAVLPSNELVVVGGWASRGRCSITEIGSS